jgi:hypothetical protein
VVYYAEKHLSARREAFTEDLSLLGLPPATARRAHDGSLEITVTPSGFEARLTTAGGGSLHIDETGRIWHRTP